MSTRHRSRLLAPSTPHLATYLLTLIERFGKQPAKNGVLFALRLLVEGEAQYLVLEHKDNHVMEMVKYLAISQVLVPDPMLRFYIGRHMEDPTRWVPFSSGEVAYGTHRYGEVGEGGRYLAIHDPRSQLVLTHHCGELYLPALRKRNWLRRGKPVVWPLSQTN